LPLPLHSGTGPAPPQAASRWKFLYEPCLLNHFKGLYGFRGASLPASSKRCNVPPSLLPSRPWVISSVVLLQWRAASDISPGFWYLPWVRRRQPRDVLRPQASRQMNGEATEKGQPPFLELFKPETVCPWRSCIEGERTPSLAPRFVTPRRQGTPGRGGLGRRNPENPFSEKESEIC
jgi:hypothetical protein